MKSYGETQEELIDIENLKINPHGISIIPLESRASNLVNEKIFENLMVKLMKLAHMSALSAAIVKDDELIWAKGFGLADRENNKRADEETIYLVASISKTFTATALMQLYEQGLFDLDDDVNDYMNFSFRNPNYPEEPITFRMLLAHQSSLAMEREDISTFFTRIYPGNMDMTGYPYPFLQDYLVPGGVHFKPQVWTDVVPGEEMYYANIGYGLLGYLVEILSGKSFEKYCSEHIFEPLGMKNSSFRFTNVNSSRVAVPYDFKSRKYYPILHYDTLDYPAGGLRTSVLDLARFLLAHMNKGEYNGVRVLNESTVELMHAIQFPSTNYKFQYGLGWQIWKTSNDTLIGHTGGLFGVSTKMVFRLSDKTGIIFFTTKEIENIREIIVFSLIERLLFGKASGFKALEWQKTRLERTILSNQHLLKNCDMFSNRYIRFYLTKTLLDVRLI
jgi:CubicO group peptidase (beta-lactamase class C family)